METICIPDAHDVLPNRRLENYHNVVARFTGEDVAISTELSSSFFLKYGAENPALRRRRAK
jgi:hypothetical protein